MNKVEPGDFEPLTICLTFTFLLQDLSFSISINSCFASPPIDICALAVGITRIKVKIANIERSFCIHLF